MQKDLENLAKEMQTLSNIRGKFSSDKEFFLYQLSYWRKHRWHHWRWYPVSEKKLAFVALAKKLMEKSASKSDFNSKQELVKKGVEAYIKASEQECVQFHKIVDQKNEIVAKASSQICTAIRKCLKNSVFQKS